MSRGGGARAALHARGQTVRRLACLVTTAVLFGVLVNAAAAAAATAGKHSRAAPGSGLHHIHRRDLRHRRHRLRHRRTSQLRHARASRRLLGQGPGLAPVPHPNGVALPSQPSPTGSGAEEIEPYSKHPSETRPYAVCPPARGRRTSCMSAVVPLPAAGDLFGPATGSGPQSSPIAPRYEGGGVWQGFSPADLRSAYNLPATGGSGLTVAVTIAYDNPYAGANLTTYRNFYGLPPCTVESGCFKKVNQAGETANYPESNEEWALETSLDLDMISVACPECHILLVEANSANYEDMTAAVDRAAQMGADVISNSWAGEEWSEETSEDVHFNHPGIPMLFASGDWGYGVEYPAASPYTIAVGGTSLRRLGSSSHPWTETAWSGAGSGCSAFEAKPAWQNDTGCPKRTVADVSAVADPQTPVSVYDSYGYSGWLLVGGTSAATPLVAGIEALSSSAFRAAGPSAFWRAGYGSSLFDVTEGENGACAIESDSGFASTYLCQGDTGYDGPTGWGTPDGPQSLPVSITELPTLSAGQATLHGSVNPNGQPTEYRFEYGETTSYGTSIPVPNGNVGSGSEYVGVNQTIEGLKPETTYHYRVTAINSATYHGVDRTFGITPPSPKTGPATNVRSTTATVEGTVNPRGARTSYYVEYGPTTAYGHKAPAKATELPAGKADVNVSVELTRLSGATLYHYRLVARNTAGTTYGDDKSVITERPQWFLAEMPQPPNSGYGEEAFAVSCLPTEECIGVGSNWSLDLHASATLGERWNGGSWTPMETPNPDGLQEGWEHQRFATLRGVSCTSIDACMAVGYFKGTSELVQPLIERWDGTEWSIVPPALPAGEESAALQSVSCVAPDDCRAAGAYLPTGTATVKSMVEHWDGTEWTVEPTTDPAEANETRLYGISCSSSTSCMAVGAYITTGPQAERTIALRWDGSEWTQNATVNPGARDVAGLWDVSCTTATACTAVGAYQLETTLVGMAERWNGASWALQSTPTPHSEGGLTSVSCTTSTDCTAGGYFYSPEETDHGWRSLIERWSGSSWTRLEIATFSLPSNWWHEDNLSGISCIDPEFCNAVGSHIESAGQMGSMLAFSEHEVTPPFPAFSSTPSTPLTDDPISFDASATDDPGHPIVSYEWDFGDGATGDGLEPSHACAHAGQYVVRLTVTDDIGRTGSVSRIVDVGDRPPAASFAIQTPEPLGGEPVAFDASASTDPDGAIVGYEWSFGDGTTGSGAQPAHAYAHAGEYVVTLNVTDNDGSSAQASKSLTIANSPPAALFSVLTQSPTAARAVTFDGSASSDADGSIAGYEWSFGDGAVGSGAQPSHTYAHAGEYAVTLATTDNEGKTSLATHVVAVADAAPAAVFSVSRFPTAGQAVSFDAGGSVDPDGAITGYSWDFGDGAAGRGPSAKHVYARAGVYRTSLTVVDNRGLTTTVHRLIDVSEPNNRFRLREIDHDTRSGAVLVRVWLPAAGVLTARELSAALHSGRSSGRIRLASLRATDPGAYDLRLVPTSAVAAVLARRRTVRIDVLLRFMPDFGTPALRMREVVLHMAPSTRHR